MLQSKRIPLRDIKEWAMQTNTISFGAKVCLKRKLLDGAATVQTDLLCTIFKVKVDIVCILSEVNL